MSRKTLTEEIQVIERVREYLDMHAGQIVTTHEVVEYLRTQKLYPTRPTVINLIKQAGRERVPAGWK